ncbi:hypothetical protein GcC1_007033 [Golovinomyces cichoracearum]|uniref:Extracellular membrane protein CFEM domain-containing protein n=1 Tax=Golovinomyces cichoracearum TaxID=62708 RepID=A0A420J8D1_9PEZI|nr:hypothetical protein GcC1_007033 [Golovinomyces cichoracearum]
MSFRIAVFALVFLAQVLSILSKDVDQSQTKELPLCSYQCGALTRFEIIKNCPLSSSKCVCQFMDSYTLCIAFKCRGRDFKAAIRAPMPVFMPEIMLVSDDDFEPICLSDKSVVDASITFSSKDEKEDFEDKVKLSLSGSTILEGIGLVLTADHKGGMVATASDLNYAELGSDTKIRIARSRKSTTGTGGQTIKGKKNLGIKTYSNPSVMNIGLSLLIILALT